MQSAGWLKPLRRPANALLVVAFVAICVFLAFRAPGFFTRDNLVLVLRSISMQALIAFGMTLVIIVGEIDLSVGSTVGFAGCLIAYLTKAGVPLPLGALITIGAGGLQGVFTGVMRTWLRVPSFITTLALFTALLGGALMITGGFPLTPFPEWYGFFGSGYVAGVPFSVVVLAAGFLVLHFMMSSTAFGRAIYATGGNAEAARLSGINVSLIRISVFAITGMLAAMSGIMLSAKLMSGTPRAAEGWELDIIAGVIIGGTSFSGGTGTVLGTLLGMVFIGVVTNGMVVLDIPVYTQYVVRGMLILTAVVLNRAQTARE